MNALDKIRRTGGAVVTGSLWLAFLYGAVLHASASGPMFVMSTLAVAAIGTFFGVVQWRSALSRLVLAACLAVQTSLVVYGAAGATYQLDYHMYYFSFMALLAVMLDWRTILLYSGVVAVHHLVLNFALPYAVFPDGADFARVLLHAVAVVIECAVLIWFTREVAAVIKGFDGFGERISGAMDENDLTFRLSNGGSSQMTGFVETINGFVSKVQGLVAQMAGGSRKSAEAAKAIDSNVQQLTDYARVQEDSAQQIAAALEETSVNINQINELSKKNRSHAERMGQQTTQVVAAMGVLQDNTKRVTQVTQTIQDISEQINLLALNASIEAARAGDSGRGFAVVADEVKKLADHVASSTQQINADVAQVENNVTECVTAIDEVKEGIGDITEGTQKTDVALQEQSAATEQITSTVNQFSESLRTVVANIDATAQEVQKVSSFAQEIDQQINSFKYN